MDCNNSRRESNLAAERLKHLLVVGRFQWAPSTGATSPQPPLQVQHHPLPPMAGLARVSPGGHPGGSVTSVTLCGSTPPTAPWPARCCLLHAPPVFMMCLLLPRRAVAVVASASAAVGGSTSLRIFESRRQGDGGEVIDGGAAAG
jgi:hypothetical protein